MMSRKARKQLAVIDRRIRDHKLDMYDGRTYAVYADLYKQRESFIEQHTFRKKLK